MCFSGRLNSGSDLTASYTWMKGYAYDFLAILHAVTVIVTLIWLPFGKLFHVFQRPAQLGVRSDGQLHVDEGIRLRFPRHSPRRDRHRHADLAAVRQAVSCVSAAGSTRGQI